jgi:hypothetical protein
LEQKNNSNQNSNQNKVIEPKIMVLYSLYGCQMLRPLDEILNFLYLNEIRTKDEHFNLATLSDK